MNKNAIHNFNISIQNSTDLKSSEDLTQTIITELAKVSREMNQQKDIEQLWQEQKELNAAISSDAGANNINSTEGGAIGEKESTGTTPSVYEATAFSSSIPIGGGVVDDSTGRMTMRSAISDNTTPPVMGAEDRSLDFSNATSQLYTNVREQQILSVPQMFQTSNNEPAIETVKEAIQKKLDEAKQVNDPIAIDYWTKISKAFEEGLVAADFDGKPDHLLFTEMYKVLKQSGQTVATVQNFNWEIIRKKMIESIDTNILNGIISKEGNERWSIIKKKLKDDTTNIANLFEQYDELFLLLREIEGLDKLSTKITITTKTKVYPNLSADRLYADIGKEAVYVFLKKISNKEIQGSAVNKGAVKIKNSVATSFVVGESLEFFLDEIFIKQHKFKKENINWIVSKTETKDKIIFRNEGTSLNYNFDTAGVYRIDAYGSKFTINANKESKEATYIEVEIVAQEIIITPPSTIKGKFIRPVVENQMFKVSLLNQEVKTLNPVKLYYQVGTNNAQKIAKISDWKELDSTGEIQLSMSDLAEYTIRVSSKDQYGLNKEFVVNTIKNYVSSIIATSENNVEASDIYFVSKVNKKINFKVKSFMIEPATQEERANVKWLIYDQKHKIYVKGDMKLQNENNDVEKPYFIKGETFALTIPKEEGNYIIEAYSNGKAGSNSISSKKIAVKHPKVTAAYWAYNNGDKKKTSGFSGEFNHVRASISDYINQPVRINFYVNDSKIVNYYNDTKTDSKGEIEKTFDLNYGLQKYLGIKNGQTAKIRFELEGIQEGEVFSFKRNTAVYSEAVLNVTTIVKITDLYFEYNNNRVTPFTQVPYGAKVKGVVKTLNKVDDEVLLQVYKNSHDVIHTAKAKVNKEGDAVIVFDLNENWNTINPLTGMMDTFYLGMEGIETKLSLENGMNAVYNNVIESAGSNIVGIDEDDPQLIWGSKVSKEFRIRVVQICKKIEKEKEIPFSPNVLMNIIAFETFKSFSPTEGTFKDILDDSKEGYVGLIQFGKDAATHLKVKRSELLKMTALEQLYYVEKWFLLKSKNELKTAVDIYLAVNYPVAAGKGHLDNEVVYGDPKSAYRANKPFLREADEINEKGEKVGKKGGKTYVWEVREALENMRKEGEYTKNTILMNNSYNLIMSNPKEILNLDTSLTFCYFSAQQIKEIRKVIDKFASNEEKMKAYRILQYFVEYNSQRDAQYKSLADTMCNVTSESIALQYLGQMNPAPDPNMKMEDFMMTMIRDILKKGDSSRYEASVRIEIANQLGIKGGIKLIGQIFDQNIHKKLLEDKLNKGYGVCMSLLGHIVRVVDVNDMGIIVDDPYGRIQSFKIRKANRNKGGYTGGKNYSDNSILKGESNLWMWEQLKIDRIIFNYYEWYYL